MLPVELTFFANKILELPLVAPLHEAGLALLREAFADAHFQIGQDIPTEVRGLCFYMGGFEVYDPSNEATLRVMSVFGHSIEKGRDLSGMAYTWSVTQELQQMRSLPVDQRGLTTATIRQHLISSLDLASMDADMVLRRFEDVLSAPEFAPTPRDAQGFVQELMDALMP
jgi:hypothetical protein